MQVKDLLTPESTQTLELQDGDKTGLLRKLAGLAANLSAPLVEDDIFNALAARERLGSTGIGAGVAIPHCRVTCCKQARGILIKLDEPIEFDSIDGHPVDLVFALLTPADDTDIHLKALSHLAALFNQDEFRTALRSAHNAADLYQQATQSIFEEQPASPS